jgi:hypothetical protein
MRLIVEKWILASLYAKNTNVQEELDKFDYSQFATVSPIPQQEHQSSLEPEAQINTNSNNSSQFIEPNYRIDTQTPIKKPQKQIYSNNNDEENNYFVQKFYDDYGQVGVLINRRTTFFLSTKEIWFIINLIKMSYHLSIYFPNSTINPNILKVN